MIATPADPDGVDPAAVLGRRRFLRGAALLATAGLAPLGSAAAAALPATPANALGPFYPPVKPADSDADLTLVAGRTQRAAGTVLYTSGRVLDLAGRPLAGAQVEVWQANAFGRYAHPGDTDASGPLDPDFQGYGRVVTDAEGRYRIKTIKPAPYGGRTPHLHFIVARGDTRLTTQMFFEGEAMNARDGLYRHLTRDDQRASTGRFGERTPAMEGGAVVTVWDIVLRT